MKPNWIKNLIKDEAGATAIEYGLIAALMAVVVITGFTALKGPLEGVFSTVGTKLSNPVPSGD
jgi:pilus assembly protein Flp/PilA